MVGTILFPSVGSGTELEGGRGKLQTEQGRERGCGQRYQQI